MKTTLKNKFVVLIILFLVAMIGIFGIQEAIKTNKAHQSFENYYAFRGCTQLLKRTTAYGLCKLSSGQTIKLVKFHGKWYLDGDLPTCFSSICL